MAKVTDTMESMSSQDRTNYLHGANASKNDKNPFSELSDIRKHQAWSAGHFDTYGRVA